MDGYYTSVGHDFAPVGSVDAMIYNKDFSHCENMPILVRKEIIGKPVDLDIYRGLIKMDYNPSEFLLEQGFSRIYDCGTVYGYIKGGIK